MYKELFMSIYNDSRRYSDDPDEYREWQAELARESSREDYDPIYYDEDEYEDYDIDEV